METDEVERALQTFEGKRVWSMGCVQVAGANFLLKAGARWRVPIKRPTRPIPRVAEKYYARGYHEHGETSLYVSCSWALERGGATEFSSAAIWATDDLWAEPLERFEGQSILRASLGDSAQHATLSFEDGSTLNINAAETELEDHDPFFILAAEEVRFIVRKEAIEAGPRLNRAELDGLVIVP